MNNDLLKEFIGGLMYFRLVCFEIGPDTYYYFRKRILNIDFDPDKGLSIETEDVFPNRLLHGRWIDHPTNGGLYTYKIVRDGNGQLPRIIHTSDVLLQIKIDLVADAILIPPTHKPLDDISMLIAFPESPYEKLYEMIKPINNHLARI